MKLRLGIAALLAMMSADAAAAGPRAFSAEDYLSYFSPGRFESYAPAIDGRGLYEVLSNTRVVVGGRRLMRDSVHVLTVAPNCSLQSGWPFYKIDSRLSLDMTWDEARKSFL